MTKLWRVDFNSKYTNVKDWLEDDVTVVAPDGEAAIKKAKRLVIGRTFEDERPNRAVNCKCVRVKISGLKLMGTAEA